MKRLLKPWWGKVIAVALLLVLLLALAAGYSVWRLSQVFPKAISFDAELWRTADTSQLDNPRCLMQRDLEQNHLKLGMTKTEVAALLGEPEEDKQTTSYYLGFCSPFGVDAMALGLEFDNDDKLSRVYDIQY
jgi:outer membrane protein assembly factor BamE (lipoprotein component of BamABCDE complex)